MRYRTAERTNGSQTRINTDAHGCKPYGFCPVLSSVLIRPTDSPELDILRENGYEGFGHGVDYVWVKKGGGVRIVAFAPVENEHTSPALSGGQDVGSDHMPVKAILRLGGGPITMDERRA